MKKAAHPCLASSQARLAHKWPGVVAMNPDISHKPDRDQIQGKTLGKTIVHIS